MLLLMPALAADPPADRAALWAGCHAQGAELVGGGSAQCRTELVQAMETPYKGAKGAEVVESFFAGMSSSGVTLGEARTSATIGGRAVSQREFTVATARAITGTVTWFEPRRRTTRFIQCSGLVADPGRAATCARRVEDVVKNGWPTWLPPTPSTLLPSVVGRPLDVPGGCASEAQRYVGRIDCLAIGGGLLVYMQLATEPTPDQLAAVPDQMKHNLEQSTPGSAWSYAPVSCSVEGTPAACWRYALAGGGRSGLSAVGSIGGVQIMAQCTWVGEGAPPPPCDQVIGE